MTFTLDPPAMSVSTSREPRRMSVTKADLHQLAAQLRLAGELLEANGETVWDTTKSWEPGPRAMNTDPGGGNRWEDNDDVIDPIPNDPTGEAATDADQDTSHRDLRAALNTIATSSTDLLRLLQVATPRIPERDPQHLVNQQLIADGWCTSCYRDNGYLEPIGTKPDGTPYYRGLCKWCGEFKARNKKQLPPENILRWRHEGRRITPQMEEREMAAQRAVQAKRKHRRRGARR